MNSALTILQIHADQHNQSMNRVKLHADIESGIL